MVDIEHYISQLINSLKQQFDSRLLYVGLQGSYLRGEANESSDLDIMVIIDELSVSDLELYRAIIQSMDHYEKSCGFICSKEDLANWNPMEISHILNTTKDYFGRLREYIPLYTENDIRNFLKMSLNNLYHEICHRYIHADSNTNTTCLAGSYKGVFFILQNLYYLKSGNFICTKKDLLSLLEGMDHAVLKRSMDLNAGIPHDLHGSFSLLFTWCQDTLRTL